MFSQEPIIDNISLHLSFSSLISSFTPYFFSSLLLLSPSSFPYKYNILFRPSSDIPLICLKFLKSILWTYVPMLYAALLLTATYYDTLYYEWSGFCFKMLIKAIYHKTELDRSYLFLCNLNWFHSVSVCIRLHYVCHDQFFTGFIMTWFLYIIKVSEWKPA